MSGCDPADVRDADRSGTMRLGDVDYPDSIAIAGGYAWVADTKNNRIEFVERLHPDAVVATYGSLGQRQLGSFDARPASPSTRPPATSSSPTAATTAWSSSR